ncbi:hypothetical protein N5I59_25650 [Klebsiella pneumoniae]|uniref:hypothetical protein n=1 Tax=Klebsiella pneumoniae TaxID=573 RepID=UPI00224558BA|nr:hypothetical protein [Klebsiella pneumoniae]MCW9194666.1 hypothetical protein [Klebsiella pneumoniae]
MAIISSKEQIKRSIEAASRGRQTAIFTPGGQLVVVNIFTPETIESLMPQLNITGTHPAFLVNGKKVSALLVGTFACALSNNEGVSQAMTPIAPANYFNAANAINAMGDKWHMMNIHEYSFFQMKSIKLGMRPMGNTADVFDKMFGWDFADHTAYGQRVDGKAPGTVLDESTNGNANKMTTIYTGSGPASFRHDRTYNGVSDLVGNGYTLLPGLRFVGKPDTGYEVQILGSDIGMMANMTGDPLNLTYNGNGDWKAIDASTGDLVSPTYTGSLVTGNYLPTTNNAIKMYPSAKVSNETLGKTGYHLPLLDNNGGHRLGDGLVWRSGLNAAAIARLRQVGALPHAEVSVAGNVFAGTNETVSMYPTAAANCLILLSPPSGLYGMVFTTNLYMDRPQRLRVCSYFE